MAPATIKLRDPPEEVRQKLGLSKQQFDNFKTFVPTPLVDSQPHLSNRVVVML